jgi:hypothetical protein
MHSDTSALELILTADPALLTIVPLQDQWRATLLSERQ